MMYFPRDEKKRAEAEKTFEALVNEEGQAFLGWRAVPTDNRALGNSAKAGEPVSPMAFLGRSASVPDEPAFERKLYVIRKRAEHALKYLDANGSNTFYIPSLSARTLVYKGLLLANQIEAYFPDLADPAMASGIALVHQRYSTNTFPTWDLAHPFRFLCHNGEINTLRGNVNWIRARQNGISSHVLSLIHI